MVFRPRGESLLVSKAGVEARPEEESRNEKGSAVGDTDTTYVQDAVIQKANDDTRLFENSRVRRRSKAKLKTVKNAYASSGY